jgi:hypothetical protein
LLPTTNFFLRSPKWDSTTSGMRYQDVQLVRRFACCQRLGLLRLLCPLHWHFISALDNYTDHLVFKDIGTAKTGYATGWFFYLVRVKEKFCWAWGKEGFWRV